MSSDQLVFGPFHIDMADERLWREQRVIPLKPKTFAVLCYLIEHAGRLITKEEFLNVLWADVRVGSAVVKVCIREIRNALGDPAKTPQYIETVARRGYRFIGPGVSSQHSGVSSLSSSPALSPQHSAPPLVGRETELAQLHSWLVKAISGERQVVFITGEAGIGKTTLVETFLRQIAGQADLWVAAGHCLEQYGAGEAYLPVLEAFGHLCREPQQEGMREVLSQYAPTWLLQMPALLGGVDLEGLHRRTVGATKERMLREMTETLEELTTTRGLVLWFDDVHWSDYSTLDLVSYLARRSQPARLLVICTYRPAAVVVHDHPLRTIKQDLQLHHHCEELPIALLTEGAVEEYLTARFSGSGIVARLTPIIHQRTEGNPLFMVNMVDHLVTQKVVVQRDGRWELAGEVAETDVPTSLREFIEQQIEEVSLEAQLVLEAGSVTEITFSAAVIAAGIGRAVGEVEQICEGLVRQARFLQRKGTEEWPDGTTAACYGFVHSLHQNVLAERVTPGRRVELHRHIGERLEAAYGARAGDLAAELALHFERGREYQRAVQYRQQAAETALLRFAYREAVAHLTIGIALVQKLPSTAEQLELELALQIALGPALMVLNGYADPAVERSYTRARQLCEQTGQAPRLFHILPGLRGIRFVRAELYAARDVAEQHLALAEATQDPGLLTWAHYGVGETELFTGDVSCARRHLQKGIDYYDPQKEIIFYTVPIVQSPGVACLSNMGWVLWLLGYPLQARVRSDEALSLAETLAHPFSLVFALVQALMLHEWRGETPAICGRVDQLIQMCHDQGFPMWRATGVVLRGAALVEHGQVADGIAQLRQGLTAYRATGAEVFLTLVFVMLARACAKAGKRKKGLRSLLRPLSK